MLKLAELCLRFAVVNTKSETDCSHMKRVENNYRSHLAEKPLSFLMGMTMDEKPYVNHDSKKPVEVSLP